MPIFVDADAAYIDWLEKHPLGHVINTYRRPHPDYLILHRATCKSISRIATAPIAWTSGDYIKVCSESIPDLAAWCRVVTGSSPQLCGQCRPHVTA